MSLISSKVFQIFFLSGRISGIIVAGGNGSTSVDFLAGDQGIRQLPNLPHKVSASSMVAHDGTILLCGGWGNLKKCLQMDHATWKEHSTLNVERAWHSAVTTQETTFLFGGGNSKNCLKLDKGTWKRHSILNDKRAWHSAITTQTATFIFGGNHSRTTYEYLPKDSTKWLMGKTDIPGGFEDGCAIAVKSEQEIWLIGGLTAKKRILSFDVESHTFQVLPFQLNVGRSSHRCAFIPNTNKVMITGGYS